MSKNLPKITVITPSYNQGKYIERTIKSVLDQNYPNLEYIVMDGGSTDNTVAILKKYEKYLTWFSEKDRGQTHAINKGLKLAQGEIFAYLNSDDTYEPNTLHTIAQFFTNHPSSKFVYGKGQLIDADDNSIGFYNDSPMSYKKLFAQCGISQPTAFWKSEVTESIGLFDESFHFTMDYEYWVRAAKKYKLDFITNRVLANTRIHPEAKTSAFTSKLHLEAIRVMKKHYKRVHHDWIFSYVDGTMPGYKQGSFSQKLTYWTRLFTLSTFYQLQWNHALPSRSMLKQYKAWLKEIAHSYV